MLILDTRTLLVVTAIISIGSTIALFSLWRTQPRHNGAGFWASGMTLITFASFLLSGRGSIPDFISIIIANTVMIIGFSQILRGICIFIKRPTLLFFDFILPAIVALTFYYFTYFENDLTIRITLFSIALVMICSAIVITLIHNNYTAWRHAGTPVAIIFGFFALAYAIRATVALLTPYDNTFMSTSTSTTLVFIAGILTIGGSAITLTLFSQAALKAELQLFSMAVKQSASSIIITDTTGAIEYVNRAFIEKSGYTKDELIGKNPRILKSGEINTEIYKGLWETLTAGDTWRGELHNRKKNGELYWEIASITPVKQQNGYISNYIAIKEDITALKNAKQRIFEMANHDALTGLPTRRLSMDRLEKYIATAKRNKTKVAVMFVDLDGFKNVNDTLGHDAGDFVLKETAARLCSTVREVDTVARIGGDEFWIFLTDIADSKAISVIADKIIKTITLAYDVEDTQINIGASIGIAIYPDHGDNSVELIKLADKAMYKVKKQGKNNYTFAKQ
ncbi:diguanylate cyclase [Psychromonas sp. MME2]|uniref:diguanylate cyclase domain-containing protein n=1 Tax=unclassified Psychromonas TaxID=2614957 RepID=UPI00339C63E0